MKKLLLLTMSLIGFTASAQLTCATATEIAADGLYTCPQITGTYPGTCAPNGAVANPNSIWFFYTATENGELTITSDLPQNVAPNSVDTRLSIISGTCTALTCYAGSDDVSDTNYLTNLTIPVLAGTTYYIVWDDRWSDLGFEFEVTFAVPACIRPNATNVLAASNVTVDSAQLNWSSSIGSPAGYDVEHGDADFVQGTGTVVNTATTSVLLSGLAPASAKKDYYLRSNCGAEQSEWIGPFRVYLAKTLPYSYLFDDTTDYSDGFTSSGWNLGNAAGGAQSGAIYYFSNSSTTAASTALLYSGAIALQANEEVTLTFYTRLGLATGSPQTLKVWVNGTPSATGATQLGGDISVTGTAYTQQTRTFTAPTAGTYYFIFNNATPIITTATSLRLDTVALTSVLRNDEFSASSVNVFPNPANSIVTISSNDTAISSIELTDVNGRMVKTIKANGTTETQINVSDLAQGIYMLKIASDKGTATKKLVVE